MFSFQNSFLQFYEVIGKENITTKSGTKKMATSKRLTLILVVVCAINAFAQEIGFPEEEDESNKNAQVNNQIYFVSVSHTKRFFSFKEQETSVPADTVQRERTFLSRRPEERLG